MKYKTIVIDPPWTLDRFGERLSKRFLKVAPGRSFANRSQRVKRNDVETMMHIAYDTMTDQEILNFPIDDFADENCDLFMWITHGKLPFGFEILKAWKFQYRNLITWYKRQGLCIHGVHRHSEFAIHAVRGKSNLDYSNTINTVVDSHRTRHSEKPKKFYDMIQKSTAEPRIDIFARQRHYGFDAWGDQVESQPLTLEDWK